MSISLSGTSSITMTGINLGSIFTVEMWLYVSQTSISHPFFQIKLPNDNLLMEIVVGPDDNQEAFSLFNIGGEQAGLPIDTWHHLTIVRSQLSNAGVYNIYIYINGKRGSSPYFGVPNFSYSEPDLDYTNVNITIGRASPFTTFIYNFELIKALPYGGVGAEFTSSMLLPTNFNDYVSVLYTKIQDTVIGGGEIYPFYQVASAGTAEVTFSNVTTSLNKPTGATVPHATICFVAGTPVMTDNSGYVPINELALNLTTGTHTIGGQAILAVTQSITPERHLVNIRKNALGVNVPSADTKVSINHKILVNGDMTEAGKLVKFNPDISFVDYNQEVLYNVVLQTHGTMTVNNMTVETLDPESLIAKMFVAMKDMSQEQRDTIVKLHNEYVKTVIM